VDGVLIPDQLANFIPAQLWTPQNTPLATMMSDPDSLMDAFMVAPYIAAVAPSLELHLTTDSVRRPPAEFIQSMLTLAQITEGKATFQIGGGELKQTKPFGHPTNQGMSRMKDLFSMYEKFLTSDGPFDFEGRRRTLHGAFLGSAMHHKPKIWGLGGGPQLLDYAATWADGIAVAVPNAWTSPEAAEKGIRDLRRRVEEKGRDPEQFRIGLWAISLMHDDEQQLLAALDNPILKFVCGAMGRVETDQWQADGYDPLPFPTGWAYYKDLLPYAMDGAFVDGVVAAVTPAHQRAGFFVGDATQVADQIKPYVEAGADWVCAFDYLPVVGDPADAPAAAGRMIDLCRRIKEMA
jgi:phthiodiolone/phenolphthiodiolone dimycocerosates ketoreductase